MTEMVEAFRQLYNTIRPHQTRAGARPIERYLAKPTACLTPRRRTNPNAPKCADSLTRHIEDRQALTNQKRHRPDPCTMDKSQRSTSVAERVAKTRVGCFASRW